MPGHDATSIGKLKTVNENVPASAACSDVGQTDIDPDLALLASNLSIELHVTSYPTLPSSEIPSSFWASTANSIGSSRKTSLQKPLTIMLTASSVEMPRWLQ